MECRWIDAHTNIEASSGRLKSGPRYKTKAATSFSASYIMIACFLAGGSNRELP